MKKVLAILMALMLMMGSALAQAPDGTPPGDPPSGGMGTPPDGDGGMGTPPDGEGGGFGGGTPPGGGTSSFEYAAAAWIGEAAEETGGSYSSDTADESAMIVDTSENVSISDADFASVLRLLDSLSRRQGTTVKEREDARKAALLTKKLKRKDEREQQ